MADELNDDAIKAAEQAKADEAAAAARAEADALLKANKTGEQKDADMVEKLVNDRLEARLAEIKGKLDNSFKQRDEALAKIADFERKEREATLKRLEEEGKHKEAYEMRLAEANAANEALRKQNTELSRDVGVKDALKSYTFKNDKAHEMAFKEIVSNLIQDDKGQWIHRSGISIKDYCEAFSKDDDQSFLFKAKTSSGGGSSSTTGNSKPVESGKSNSLFNMTQAEVLRLAAEGKLPKR